MNREHPIKLGISRCLLGDEVRFFHVQFIERTIEEYPFRVQHRPHRPVAHEHPLVDGFEKGRFCHCYGLIWYRNVGTSTKRYELPARSRHTDVTP